LRTAENKVIGRKTGVDTIGYYCVQSDRSGFVSIALSFLCGIMCLYADYRNDKRQFIAAVGGGVIDDNVRDFALKRGLFVIMQSGKNIEVIQPKGKPKVW